MRRWVVAVAVAGLAVAAVGAETATLPPVDERLATGVQNPNDAALVIGIEEYPLMPAGAKTVPYALRDAEAFRTWLVYTRGVPSDRVKVLGNGAKRGQIEAEARKVAQLGRSGTVWLYFSGHGSADSNRAEARLVLPADADASAESLKDDAVDLDALYGLLASEGARVVSVVDACYTGTAKGSDVRVAPTNKSFLLRDRALPGRVVEWTAAQAGQPAVPLPAAQHGAFTYAALGALRGWADGELDDRRDGKVTFEEADLYVQRVLDDVLGVRGQTPVLDAGADVKAGVRSEVLVASPKLQARPSDAALAEALGRVTVPPTPQPPVVTPIVGGGGGFAVEDLDVSAALARQEAETEAQRQADAAQAARLQSEVTRLQGEARTAWSKLGPQLEACTKLADAAQRAPCITQAERFVSWAKGLVAEVSAGTETVTTKVGPLVRAVAARRETVVVPELAAAEAALAKVKAGPQAVVAPGGSAPCGPWSGGQGCTVARIPKGTFLMGSPTSESGRDSDEAQVSVTLTRDFLLMTTEVTQGLYQAVTGKNPSSFTSCGAKCPVEQVSWYDAVSFANALSAKDGLTPAYTISGTTVTPNWGANGWRLPTEAEWERAARGGQSSVYAGGNEIDSVAWYGSNSGDTTHAVCTKKPNAYGLCDMSGNVSEWTWDWDADSRAGGTDPAGPSSGSDRVVRGGSWSSDPALARVANRRWSSPGFASSYLGFRLARSAP